MTEQVRLDEIVTNIMYGLSGLIEEQERLNKAKAILYMTLSKVQIYQEETAISTTVDSSTEWIRLFLSSMAVRGCTKKSVEAYANEYRFFLAAINKPLPDVVANDVKGYLAHCKLVRKNSDQTINNKTRMLRGLFKWLTEEEYIIKDPMIKIHDNKVEHKVKDIFADEEITIIKDLARKQSIRDIAIVDFLHRTGVRISEMLALNRDDIDLQGRQCVVYGKGRKERPVYFNGEAAVHLSEYLNSRIDSNPALFVSSRRPYGRLSPCAVRTMLKGLCSQDDRLSKVSANPHKWRRQFVTELLEKDVPLTLVADLAGHSNLNTTKNNYGNYKKSKAREAHRKYIS